ncbi:Ig-like domain-containing protein [Singulisphaera sp. PoT]|uniref:Ig-like domain-containing protein n=1 Tax=Singulisphaera sp. PoT TaxID=3411797 RepID=UPI003BF533CF
MIHGHHWPGLLVVLISLGADAPDVPQRPAPSTAASIRWNRATPKTPASVDVLGIDAGNLKSLANEPRETGRWAELFSVAVFAPKGSDDEPPPILGSYRVVDDVLRFQPRFPIDAGLRLRARFRPSHLPRPASPQLADVTSEAILIEPSAKAPPSEITRVDPSTDHPPENLLKFYLHFSQPMARGEAYRRVRLLDEAGKALELPFLEIGEELWDPSGTRLTLLLDPGRIKRGLRPRLEEGPIFLEGKTYILVVDEEWPDASGQPMRVGHRKTFKVDAMDERQPDPKSWKVIAPAAGGRDELVLRFPEPLDRAMLDRVFAVLDPSGEPVEGRVTIDQDDSRWRFSPQQPWGEGDYRLAFSTELEDLAGNSVARPFEVDMLRPVGGDSDYPRSSSIAVTIRKPGRDSASGGPAGGIDAKVQQFGKK